MFNIQMGDYGKYACLILRWDVLSIISLKYMAYLISVYKWDSLLLYEFKDIISIVERNSSVPLTAEPPGLTNRVRLCRHMSQSR